MAVTRLTDVIEPVEFTNYIVENTAERTAFARAGIMMRNSVVADQLRMGSDSFSVPFWKDLGNDEADIANDDPNDSSTPYKVTASKQLARKCFLHSSWSAMNLASELSGSDAMIRIRERVQAYWERQLQRRLVATLKGIRDDNIANDSGDMVYDIALDSSSNTFSATAVIDAAGTLGDAAEGLTGIAMHSAIYRQAQKANLIEYLPDSEGRPIRTYRGMAVIVDDGLTVDDIISPSESAYWTVLFGPGAIGYGMAEPRVAPGTEVENEPSAGNGGGQQILHSRVNLCVHPLGFSWVETSVAGESPTITELEGATNWNRVATERKQVPLVFLRTR